MRRFALRPEVPQAGHCAGFEKRSFDCVGAALSCLGFARGRQDDDAGVRPVSVEVVGGGWGGADRQWQNAAGFDGNDVVLILQNSFDQQKLVVHHGSVVLLK